ncbi:hypothetical protein NBO_152g0003 [Nosema bombycis CQ1]|uniref:Uncharacterized protein n=1 Tax=Nosema bombycis (strain CQ1 / CVCC 102059) TaxID=578461 RepID=R0MG98_NOSB1|nr:hypothetical protein NBO_152g0003 [Nosema bombycis CQ1]|eukprot:EOB13165.1 hypothetical protein NBO_152g0003 [Nosema bombycis CQ1]
MNYGNPITPIDPATATGSGQSGQTNFNWSGTRRAAGDGLKTGRRGGWTAGYAVRRRAESGGAGVGTDAGHGLYRQPSAGAENQHPPDSVPLSAGDFCRRVNRGAVQLPLSVNAAPERGGREHHPTVGYRRSPARAADEHGF